MVRTRLLRALLISAALLVVTGAAADPPKSEGQAKGQGQNHAAEPAKNDGPPGAAKAGDKKDQPPGKNDDRAKGKDDAKKDDAKGKDDPTPGNSGEARAQRRARQHAEQKAKLLATLKGPPDEALKQELRRHAERSARLARIKALSIDAKDKDVTERVTKLIEKEDARHDKWMSKHAAAGSPAATTTAAGATPPPAASNDKGGAK